MVAFYSVEEELLKNKDGKDFGEGLSPVWLGPLSLMPLGLPSMKRRNSIISNTLFPKFIELFEVMFIPYINSKCILGKTYKKWLIF